ncbi:MAG: periplasmic heavy metal sensor [Alphaproteobacteria bacterium GM202ARS2]|nr:periplasmic heavy metal sensor [Alphaproteobacteria bacterium GM202ARS2]
MKKFLQSLNMLPTWVIALSLFLNLAIVGTVLGAVIFAKGHGYHMTYKLNRAQDELSTRAQNITKPIIEQVKGTIKDNRQHIRQTIQKMRENLTSEHYDPQAFQSNYQDLRMHMDDMQEQLYRAVHDIAVDLPNEERRQFFENVLKARYFRGHRRAR